MRYRQCIVLILATLCFTSPSQAQGEYALRTDAATKARYFIFTSPRGAVRFNHDLHLAKMNAEFCLPCHKAETPVKGHTMTRFDQQFAHSFCKGCHRKNDRGPVECHECHKANKGSVRDR